MTIDQYTILLNPNSPNSAKCPSNACMYHTSKRPCIPEFNLRKSPLCSGFLLLGCGLISGPFLPLRCNSYSLMLFVFF